MAHVIRQAGADDPAEWLRMRRALWPETTPEEHEAEMAEILAQPGDEVVFVVARAGGGLGGFLEVSLRRYAEGCTTRPVGYIEGWYVDPDLRRQGVGAQLVEAAEAWAVSKGCREMGSDTEIDNVVSRRAHLALGYEEVGPVIHFRKGLGT